MQEIFECMGEERAIGTALWIITITVSIIVLLIYYGIVPLSKKSSCLLN